MVAQVAADTRRPAGAFVKEWVIPARAPELSPTSGAYGTIMFAYPGTH
jgi:hypothetical protein